SKQGYANCTTLSVFADPPRPAAAPAAPAPAKGWVYEENVREPAKADFRGVAAAVAAMPAAILRADFSAASGGGASSARQVVPQDFSTVQADVASDAPTLGNPLFIAAPYRPPLRSEAPRRAAPALAT